MPRVGVGVLDRREGGGDQEGQGMRVLTVIVVVVILVGCLGLCESQPSKNRDHFNRVVEAPTPTPTPTPTPEPPTTWRDYDSPALAYSVMKDFVKQQLISPSTAKFPGFVFGGANEHVTPLGDHKFKIASYLDAQNAFGAMIRTNYVGVVQQVSEYGWDLLSLEFTER